MKDSRHVQFRFGDHGRRKREKGMGKREGKIAVRNSLGRELEERAEVR